MATVWNEHVGEPVNDGERRVVDRLAEELPDDFFIVPYIQIHHRDRVDEIDAIIVAPFGVIVVEIKDYSGKVAFEEQQHLVNDERRKNPIHENGGRARRLKGKLTDASTTLRYVWVTDQVVLARSPEELSVDETIASKVTVLDDAARRLADPEQMLPPHIRRQPLDPPTVLRALRVSGRKREETETYGGYQTTSLLEKSGEGRLYEAYKELDPEKTPVLLRIHVIGSHLSTADREAVKDRALRSFRALCLFKKRGGGIAPQMILPDDAFVTATGDIAIISPLDAGIRLTDLADETFQWPPEVRLAVIRDVAKALDFAHSHGVAHRRISPISIFLDVHQKDLNRVVARVGDWDRADLGGPGVPTGRSSLHFEDTAFVAPEVVGDHVENWVAADLWSLARIVEWVWKELQGAH